MRKTLIRSALRNAFAIYLVVATSMANATTISDSNLDRLIRLSGIVQQIDSIPGTVEAGIFQAAAQSQSLNKAKLEKIATSVRTAFDAPQMLEVVRAQLKNTLTEADAKQLLIWFESDLGKKITATEDAATVASAVQIDQAEFATLMADQTRVALLQKIIDTTQLLDFTLDIQRETTLAVFTGLVGAEHPGEVPDTATVVEALAAQESQLRTQFMQIFTEQMAYTYRSLSIEDLEGYVAYLSTPEANNINSGVQIGLTKAYSDATPILAKTLADLHSGRSTKQAPVK